MYKGHIVTKKEFKKRRNDETLIVAQTSRKTYDEEKHKKYDYVLLEHKENDKEYKYLIKDHVFGFKNSYIDVGDNKYILVKEKAFFIILWLFLGLLLLGCLSLHSCNTKQVLDDIIVVGDNIEEYKEPKAEQLYIEVPGLRSSYNLSADNQEIFLINPEGNTVYFKYSLMTNGEEIFVTDYINPNAMIKANLYEILDAGVYEIDVTISTIDIETQAPCNGANLNTKVVINK